MVEAILAAVVALFGLIGTALTSGVNSSKKENESLKKENAELKARLEAEQQKMKTVVDDAVSGRDKVIAGLKAEIEILEKDLAAHSSPADVRDRLRKLLSVP